MANLKLTSQEFIQNSFCPLVASMCSPLVEQTCQKNNLTFTELVQPFCKLTSDAYIKDPAGSTIPIKHLKIKIKDVNSQPPQPPVARKLLNEAVSSNINDRTAPFEVGGMLLDIPNCFPWFEAWRETFLQVQFPSDHEFINHYLACILVVSSKEPNPIEQLTKMGEELGKMQIDVPNSLPKWFTWTNILRYYVLLHDNLDSDINKSENVFEAMKSSYGDSNCFFLKINSQTPDKTNAQTPDMWKPYLLHRLENQGVTDVDLTPVENHMIESIFSVSGVNIESAQEAGESSPVILHPLSPIIESQQIVSNNNSVNKELVPEVSTNTWTKFVNHGSCLTKDDIDRVKICVNEFCLNCLIPYVENYIHQLNDIISNKKGVSRSLLSATKRWFGSNKPGIPNNALPPTAITYSNESPEIQLRRLGDLYFMFHAYSLAYSVYHTAKRDFCADSAWLYYAGALEMAALSLFLSGDNARKAHDYADESISTYLNSCRLPQFATRATLFSTECLKNRGMYGEAAKQLIRMTSEESDLRSALLLEQAAYCFLLSIKPVMPRKYSFHLVLAGHRFSKSNQKRHSLRCYRQAYQVYEDKNWSLAEDHIHHTIGRMASGLEKKEEAAEAFARLLPRGSRQAPQQQATFLKEYLVSQEVLILKHCEVPVFPLPVVEGSSVQVLLSSSPELLNDTSTTNENVVASGVTFNQNPQDKLKWLKLEEQVVGYALEGQPFVFKPTVDLFDNTTNNAKSPNAYVNEFVFVSISLNNPLHIPLNLQNIKLLWSYVPGEGGICQDNQPGITSSTNPAAISQVLSSLTIEPDSTKKVVLYVVPKSVGELRITGLSYSLYGDGISPVEGRQHLIVPTHTKKRSSKDTRSYDIIDNRLKLNVVDSAPCLKVTFNGLRSELVCGELQYVDVDLYNNSSTTISRIMVTSSFTNLVSIGDKKTNGICVIPLNEPLQPMMSISIKMLLRAPDLKGASVLHLLFYYESSVIEKLRPRYRLVKHAWSMFVYESIQVSAIASRSCSSHHADETINISLSVKNKNQIQDPLLTEISLHQVSLYSENWILTQQLFSPPGLQVEAQEVVHLVMQAKRKTSSNNHEISSVDLIKDGNQLLPIKDFLYLSNSCDDESTNLCSKELQSLASLNCTLIIMWKGEVTENSGCKRIADGQHHVQLEKINKLSSWPPDPSDDTFTSPAHSLKIFSFEPSGSNITNNSHLIKQGLLMFSLVHPTTIKHDFSINRVCKVGVKIVVQNCCESFLNVKIEGRGPISSSYRNQNVQVISSPRSAISFYWVGKTVSVHTLKPHSREEVLLSVVITASGTYDLGSHVTTSARLSDSSNSDYVNQIWRPETMLIVS